MCFSATASFGASAVLGVIGVASLTKVQTTAHAPFAAIPLLFGVQQASEGILWVMLGDSSYVSYQHRSWPCVLDISGTNASAIVHLAVTTEIPCGARSI